jgi:uracil-DNA glycosylase family protein
MTTVPRPAGRMPATEAPPTARHLPANLAEAAKEAAGCRACPLWKPATQTVFGEGPADAAIMLVGEQPGDVEDMAGRPFVGPAGKLLDHALLAAGLDRTTVYVTNAVKHFKFVSRGKRRLHQKPDAGEITACRFWLDLERSVVQPRLIVLLGATAARAVLGRAVTISRERGKPLPLEQGSALLTVHPSYVLRLPDEADKQREYQAFVSDLRLAHTLIS